MIYGNVNNPMFEDQAAVLPDALSAALHFLKETDLAAHEPGVFNIELGGVPVILQVLDLTTSPREALRPEIHRKNIDIRHLPAAGPLRREPEPRHRPPPRVPALPRSPASPPVPAVPPVPGPPP